MGGRIEAGAQSVSPEPTDAAVLVDRARNTFLSGGGRDNLNIDLPRDLPRVMAAQAERRRGRPHIHLHRASRRLPDAEGDAVVDDHPGVNNAGYFCRERQLLLQSFLPDYFLLL